jgi:hypothetical protein
VWLTRPPSRVLTRATYATKVSETTRSAGGGSDFLSAAKFSYDTDNLDGGSGVDTLNAADGDNRDRQDGGGGDWDKCKGDPLDDFDNCEIIER